MQITTTRPISLYDMSNDRVRMATVPPGTYDLEVITNPADPRGGPWYRLTGTNFGAATTWIEEMGNDPTKTGVTIVGAEKKAPSPQQPTGEGKKKKWLFG